MRVNNTSLHRVPISVWFLGLVSMFMDISSEMIHSLLPMFLVGSLGISTIILGLIEGVAESTAHIIKVFSGALSDYLGKRKVLATFGYLLGAVSKPLFAIAPSATLVFTARFIDRIGKGIRGAPRDALIADVTPPSVRGAAFGLRQSLDSFGAILGPLLAVALMLLLNDDFRTVFWFAVIPGFLSVFLLVVGVKEPETPSANKRSNPLRKENLMKLNRSYWWVVGIGAVFTLARFSEAFLVLRAQQLGIPTAFVPLMMVIMNLVYSASAYPFGKISDNTSHNKLLSLGLLVLIASNLMLASGTNMLAVALGISLWGLHLGITQGLLATMVADSAPMEMRGTAFGFFNLVSGIALLIASVTAGVLWDGIGASSTFYAGAGFSSLAFLGLVLKAWRL